MRRGRSILVVCLGVVCLAIATSGCGPKPTPGESTVHATGTAQSAAPAESEPTTPPKVITIGWVGDTTPGSSKGLPPDEGRALFAEARAQLQEPDLMIGNLEGTFTDAKTAKSAGDDPDKTHLFKAPPEYAGALAWAGFDLMNLANNHTYDYSGQGLQDTKEALAKHKISWTGMPDQITTRTVDGVSVAVIGVSPYWWSTMLNNVSNARWLVETAARDADIVVVTMHAGTEGGEPVHVSEGPEYAYGEFRGNPREFAHAVVDAGADLVFGSGPHVPRGIERYKGRLIAYSAGNFAGWGNFNLSGKRSLTGVLAVEVDQNGEIVGGQWHSMRMKDPGVPQPDADNEAARLVRDLSEEDFEDTFEMDDAGIFGGSLDDGDASGS